MLSKGQRDDNILRDAVSRLDEDSNSTKALIESISGAIDEQSESAARLILTRCGMPNFEAKKRWLAAIISALWTWGNFNAGKHLAYANKFKF